MNRDDDTPTDDRSRAPHAPGTLLDLPLTVPAEREPEPEPPEPAPGPAGPARWTLPPDDEDENGEPGGSPGAVPPAEPEPESRRRRPVWPWLVLLLLGAAAGAAAVYFWPRAEPPRLAPSAEILDFGAERPGRTTRQVLTLGNAGEEVLEIERLEIAGHAAAAFAVTDDDCTGRTIPAGEACGLAVTFGPPAPDGAAGGERQTATLRVHSNAVQGPVSVPLVGLRVVPRLTAAPSRLDFGRRPTGARAAPETVRLANRGTAPLEVRQARIEGDGAADFLRVTDACSGALLEPGEECAVRIAFTPRAAREAEARLVVGSDAGGDPLAIPLSGSAAVSEPVVGLSPASIDFGPERLGSAGRPRPVRLENRGEDPLPVREVDIRGQGFEIRRDGCGGRVLPPGDGCEVQVLLAPETEGEQTARVVFLYDRPGRPEGGEAAVTLTGSGTAPRLAVEPERVELGTVRVGGGQEGVVTVSNPGSAPLPLAALELAGGDRQSFSADVARCAGETLPPGGSCRVGVAFRPVRPGAQQAALVVRPGAGAGSAREVVLTGTGEEPPPPPPAPRVARLAVSPASLAYGDQPVGRRSGIETVRVENSGDARLDLEGITVEGPAAADFQVVPGTCDVTPFLAPGGDCTLGLRFVPSTAGERRARLVVTGSAGRRTVELSGRGVP